jgi:hypothetical protein
MTSRNKRNKQNKRRQAERERAVADERKFADIASLRPVVRAAFGSGRPLRAVERLRGGSKKGAYRLRMDDDRTALAYI